MADTAKKIPLGLQLHEAYAAQMKRKQTEQEAKNRRLTHPFSDEINALINALPEMLKKHQIANPELGSYMHKFDPYAEYALEIANIQGAAGDKYPRGAEEKIEELIKQIDKNFRANSVLPLIEFCDKERLLFLICDNNNISCYSNPRFKISIIIKWGELPDEKANPEMEI